MNIFCDNCECKKCKKNKKIYLSNLEKIFNFQLKDKKTKKIYEKLFTTKK